MFECLFGKSFDPVKDIPDLSGKVILVTGGNTGLGKETVLQLAKHNPKNIYLAARTQSKAASAIAEIKKTVPNASVEFLQLDLTSFAAVKKAADEFQSRSNRIDILINNAGVMALPWGTTEQGYEIQLGVNHMGHALFTKLLMPTLLKTAEEPGSDVRVINLSSEGHMMGPGAGIVYDQAALEPMSTWRRYGNSKVANILHARELAARYPSITATSLHPGVVKTDLYASQKEHNVIMRWSMLLFADAFLGDIPYGAKNPLWAATAPKDEVRKSYYWTPIGKASSGSFWGAKKENLAKELWKWTEGEFDKHGY